MFNSSAWHAMAESAAGSHAVAEGMSGPRSGTLTRLASCTSEPVNPTGRNDRCGSARSRQRRPLLRGNAQGTPGLYRRPRKDQARKERLPCTYDS